MALAPSELDARQEDIDAVTKATLDYLLGYVEGDPDRHAEAYHPEALKRHYLTNESGGEVLRTITPQMMVDWTATGVTRTDDTESTSPGSSSPAKTQRRPAGSAG